MTIARIEKVALVAHYSKQGDWGFELALRLARKREVTLNIFHFPNSPYEPSAKEHSEKELIALDRKLREYYDERLGDFVEVGFRVCENVRQSQELHRCLMRREYQLLIVPYLSHGVSFGELPIEEFAHQFIAPMVLVGPERPDMYRLNPPAAMLDESVDLMLGDWTPIATPEEIRANERTR